MQFLFKPRLIGIVVSAIAISLELGGLWQPLENLNYNLLFQLRQQTPFRHHWDSRIAIIAIDEATLKRYGRLSDWDRHHFVQLLQRLAPVQPTAIAFDLIFSEPTGADSSLAEEFALNGNIVLAVAPDSQQKQIELVPALAQASQWGHVAVRRDSDGIPRQASLYIGDFPAFALTALKVHQQSLQQTLEKPPPRPFVPLPEPLGHDQEYRKWINWPAPTQNLPSYSFQAVINGQPIEALANKIVLVGATASGLDPLSTPFDQRLPTSGIYFQAALLNNLLQDNFLRPLPLAWVLGLLVGLTIFTLSLLNRGSWKRRLILLSFLLLGWPAIAFLAFCLWNSWLPLAAPVGTILLTAMGLQLWEQYEKQELMQLFAQHISPSMAEDVWQRRQEIFTAGQLEVRELTVTVVFVDIRGFTHIAEELSPKQLLSWLNRYFEAMSLCIQERDGVIDKYIGDAIMAVFGVPFPRDKNTDIQQDALQAVATSLALVEQLKILNQELAAENQPKIEIGIGIHTGPVVAGSVGSGSRLNYSVIGDTVNVAARLEALNKNITTARPYPILLSDRTFNYVQKHYLTLAMGEFSLPGKAIATSVYTILGTIDESLSN